MLLMTLKLLAILSCQIYEINQMTRFRLSKTETELTV